MKREVDSAEQEAFIREVTEEVKNDQLKQMWEKYGIFIILLVVVVLVGAVSFEGFRAWQRKKAKLGLIHILMPLALKIKENMRKALRSWKIWLKKREIYIVILPNFR